MGMRAFSASSTMRKATAAKARLGYMANSRCASVSTIVVSCVEPEMNAAVKRVISIAGSARKPIIISRRAPRPPNDVPVSIAASAPNTRAMANTPTSAIMSAAGAKGRLVATTGTIAAASHMQPKSTYGVMRKSGEAVLAMTASLWKSFASV